MEDVEHCRLVRGACWSGPRATRLPEACLIQRQGDAALRSLSAAVQALPWCCCTGYTRILLSFPTSLYFQTYPCVLLEDAFRSLSSTVAAATAAAAAATAGCR